MDMRHNSCERTPLGSWIPLFILLAAVLISGRGLLRTTPLAGHDASACLVTQQAFFLSLSEGHWVPRWAGDLRFGFGDASLSFRPPLLHYLAAPAQALTHNPVASIHVALLVCLGLAALGLFLWIRAEVGARAGCVAGATFIGSSYLLADLYLRGAYYEVAAAAAMPWILWAQSARRLASRRAALVGPLAWVALIMAHPAIAFFFVPLGAAHAAFASGRVRRCLLFFMLGILVAAPYWLVMVGERPLVRLELFLTGDQSWSWHFLTLKQLFFEFWPDQYQYIASVDAVGRPWYREMRGLGPLFVAVLAFAPPLLYGFARRNPLPYPPLFRATVFFYGAALLLGICAFPISYGLWNRLPFMDTFNFPWRVLLVVNLCLAVVAAGLVGLLSEWLSARGWQRLRHLPAILFLLASASGAARHSGGWPSAEVWTPDAFQPEALRQAPGLPQHFYTPKWVHDYPLQPESQPAWTLSGDAQIVVQERRTANWKLHVAAKQTSVVEVAHFYYPGWRVDGLPNASVQPDPKNGLITFTVPPGEQELALRFGTTPLRTTATVLSFAGLAGLLALLFVSRRAPPFVCPHRIPRAAGLLCCGLLALVYLAAEYLNYRDGETLRQAGLAQLDQNDDSEAIRTFSRRLRQCETDIDARFNLAVANHHNGWHNEALEHYDRTLFMARDYAVRAAHSAARLHALRGDLPLASLYYEEALRLQPDAQGIREEYQALLPAQVPAPAP